MDISTFVHLKDVDAALIIRLLQQDGEELVSTAVGKGKQGKQPEGTMADIQSAVQLDGDAFFQSQHEERIAEQDRNLSVSLGKGESGLPVSQNPLLLSTHDEELLEKMACIYITRIDNTESDDETIKRLCEACGEQKHFAELSRAPCQHEYCRQCLSRLFRDAIIDESLFPPRCCRQPIPLDKSQLFLDANVVRQFRQKAVELATPNRTYCHNTSCAVFIPPSNYSYATATCGECGGQTCITYKGALHEGDCPNDGQLQQVIQLAREQGWQRCQNCWSMVELHTGCHHMTCRCGSQFCYVCGARWKTCHCEHWVEHRLLERAAQIDARDHVDQEREPMLPNPNLRVREGRQREIENQRERDRQQRIQVIARDLRENHECDHERWSNRGGPQECEECHDVMPIFIYECRQCHIMACRRCRYHRL
ncbi:hypothetical protein F4824DRAFT_486430 [Ustulina deusta]|nr:hypothetical protein F4824DRAFT_486430 [Ustulina deusta]